MHISNTFFLPALMGEQSEEVAHSRLTRWLKKEVTPLPNKDIIFIPIHHQHQHWSLAVVVYPWRAVNFSVRQPEGAVAHAVAGPASQLIGKQLPLGTLQAHGLKAAPCQPVLAKAFVDSPSVASIPRCAAARCLKAKWTPPLCPTKPNFHLRKDSHSKARMFHVDSMGLRAEFDRCRGRLKRFLQRVRKRHKPTSESSAFGASCILVCLSYADLFKERVLDLVSRKLVLSCSSASCRSLSSDVGAPWRAVKGPSSALKAVVGKTA